MCAQRDQVNVIVLNGLLNRWPHAKFPRHDCLVCYAAKLPIDILHSRLRESLMHSLFRKSTSSIVRLYRMGGQDMQRMHNCAVVASAGHYEWQGRFGRLRNESSRECFSP